MSITITIKYQHPLKMALKTFTTADGSANQALVTNGSGVLSFAAVGGGKVLQVVNATAPTEINSSSSAFTSTGLSASITPTSASSKILIFVNQTGLRKENNVYMRLKLQRGTTDISNIDFDGGFTGDAAANSFGGTGICYLDNPATTSSISYRTVFNSATNSALVYCQVSGSVSTMTLMEIAV